jgi:hypothetical protein
MLLIWFMNGDGKEIFGSRVLIGARCVSASVYRIVFFYLWLCPKVHIDIKIWIKLDSDMSR